ncbi:MAG: undecaprenyl-diphosphate phosphatase [Synergistales bacterium]|nr:undecaprenyl-diphosphate phosphatase [Synergistales bacterium]
MIESSLLGLVQGLTEFLPVSSSGHLGLAQVLLRWSEPPLSFDILLHVATMTATILYFRRDLIALAVQWGSGFGGSGARDSEGWRMGWAILAGTVVTGVVGIALKPFVEVWIGSLAAIGAALLGTGAVLLAGSRLSPSSGAGRIGLVVGLVVGLVQGFAVIPGISRSGITIVTALFLGVRRDDAFRFSFLLSLPAIAGGLLLELTDTAGVSGFVASLPSGWIAGAVIALVSGLFSLMVLRKVVIGGRWGGFAWYCFAIGGLALAMSVMR